MRSDTSGEVIFKDVLKGGATVAGILSADYRNDGRTEVIVCSAEGEVRAYLPAGEELDETRRFDSQQTAGIGKANE